MQKKKRKEKIQQQYTTTTTTAAAATVLVAKNKKKKKNTEKQLQSLSCKDMFFFISCIVVVVVFFFNGNITRKIINGLIIKLSHCLYLFLAKKLAKDLQINSTLLNLTRIKTLNKQHPSQTQTSEKEKLSLLSLRFSKILILATVFFSFCAFLLKEKTIRCMVLMIASEKFGTLVLFSVPFSFQKDHSTPVMLSVLFLFLNILCFMVFSFLPKNVHFI